MKIVVLDGYTENPGDLSWEGLQELGELTVYDRTPVGDTAEIIRRIGDARLSLPIRRPSQRKYLRHAAISVMWVCWLPGTMWWIVSQHQPRESLYAIFLHMEQLRLPSIQLPCFWKSATISAITVRLSMKAGGKAVRTGVFGIIPLSSWRERL